MYYLWQPLSAPGHDLPSSETNTPSIQNYQAKNTIYLVVQSDTKVLEDSVDHVHPLCVALVSQVQQGHLLADNVLCWHLWSGPDDGGDLITEDVEELNAARDAMTILSGGKLSQTVKVNQSILISGSSLLQNLPTTMFLTLTKGCNSAQGSMKLAWQERWNSPGNT